MIRNRIRDLKQSILKRLHRQLNLAEADSTDRELETSGAVKVASSLAAIDGTILLTPLLEVVGFGVKITSTANVTVYDAQSLFRRPSRLKRVDISRFGMRHLSVFRYCKSDPKAIGIIVSQDGQTRLVTTYRRRLVLWEQIRLLSYDDNPTKYFEELRRLRIRRKRSRRKNQLGYTRMPKTFDQLMQRRSRTPT